MATSLNNATSEETPEANQNSTSFGKKNNPAPFPAYSADDNEDDHTIRKSDITVVGGKV